MKINKQMVDSMLSLNDEQLWQMIKMIAAGSGVDISQIKAPPQNLSAIRNAISSMSDDDIKRASEIIEIYKKSK